MLLRAINWIDWSGIMSTLQAYPRFGGRAEFACVEGVVQWAIGPAGAAEHAVQLKLRPGVPAGQLSPSRPAMPNHLIDHVPCPFFP